MIEILVEAGRVRGVKTADGEYHAPVVVNAGGPWSYLNAELAETVLPTAAIGHYYLTTRPDPAHPVDRLSPAVRNRELRIYTRPESGGLIVGIYDAEPDLHDMRKLPVDFDMSRMKAARDSIQVARLHRRRQPALPVDQRAHADDDHHRHHDVHARCPAVLRKDARHRRPVSTAPAFPATASCKARRSA